MKLIWILDTFIYWYLPLILYCIPHTIRKRKWMNAYIIFLLTVILLISLYPSKTPFISDFKYWNTYEELTDIAEMSWILFYIILIFRIYLIISATIAGLISKAVILRLESKQYIVDTEEIHSKSGVTILFTIPVWGFFLHWCYGVVCNC